MTASRGSAIAVVGRDAVATARAALDLARTEAQRRPVTVIDLIGDAPPLREVLLTDDAHGVADCFAYGVSFAAVSRPTTADPHVSVIPSGSEPLIGADTLQSARWDRLIAQARERGTVLVFAALAGRPGLDALVARVDRVIQGVPDTAMRAAPISPPAATMAGAGPRARAAADASRARRSIGLVAGMAAGLLVVATAVWLFRRPAGARAGSAALAAAGTTATRDTLTSTAQLATPTRGSAGASGSLGGMAVVDPQDSIAAAAFAIRIGTYPSYEAALRMLRREVRRGAATITPLAPEGKAGSNAADARPQAFVVYVAAARTAGALDTAARAWLRAGGFAGGVVTHTPYALRLTDRVGPDSALRATVAWRARGIPAYALNDESGGARVYAGAFVSIDQAAALAASLHAIGLTPVLAYRVGQAP